MAVRHTSSAMLMSKLPSALAGRPTAGSELLRRRDVRDSERRPLPISKNNLLLNVRRKGSAVPDL